MPCTSARDTAAAPTVPVSAGPADRSHPRQRRQPARRRRRAPGEGRRRRGSSPSAPRSSARGTTPSTRRPSSSAPDGARPLVRPDDRRQPRAGRWSAAVAADAEGGWAFRVEGWSDPYGTWEHDAGDQDRAPGVDAELMLAEGVRVLERASPMPSNAASGRRRAGARRRRHGPARTPPARPGAARAGDVARGPGRARRARRCASSSRPSHDLPAARRARARPVRRVVRDVPPLRGARTRRGDRHVGLGHPAHRRAAAAGDRGDGLRRRLPDPDPPDRHDGTARAATTPSPPRPATPASPLCHRLARRRARRDPPRPGHLRGLRLLRRRGRASRAWRSRSTSRCSAPPTTRGSPSTRSGSRRAPTARSPTPRTRRRSTRTSTRSTSTTTRPGLRRDAPGDPGTGSTTASRVFRVDNPHTKPVTFWEWLIAEVARDHPEVIFLSEAFTKPAMMHTSAKVGFQQSLHVLHLAQREVGARGVRAASSPATARHTCARPSGPRRTTSSRPTCSTAGRAAFEAARRPRRARWCPPGASTPATSYASTSPGPAPRSRSTTRSTSTRTARLAALRARRSSEGQSLAPYLTRLNEIRREHPALQLAAQPALPRTSTTSTSWSSRKRRIAIGRRASATTRHRGRQPRPALHPRDRRAPRHAGARAAT